MPEPQKQQLYPMAFLSRIGLTRLMPDSEFEASFPLMNSDVLTEEEKREYRIIFYRTSLSKDMLNEIDYLKGNAKQVAENEPPTNTPMYFFVSAGQEDVAQGWKQAQTNYLSEISVSRLMQLETGHYIHYEEAELIAQEVKAFLEEIK
ncbi:MAG: hypothetical protein ACOCYU_03955 [Brevefilum sp.]